MSTNKNPFTFLIVGLIVAIFGYYIITNEISRTKNLDRKNVVLSIDADKNLLAARLQQEALDSAYKTGDYSDGHTNVRGNELSRKKELIRNSRLDLLKQMHADELASAQDRLSLSNKVDRFGRAQHEVNFRTAQIVNKHINKSSVSAAAHMTEAAKNAMQTMEDVEASGLRAAEAISDTNARIAVMDSVDLQQGNSEIAASKCTVKQAGNNIEELNGQGSWYSTSWDVIKSVFLNASGLQAVMHLRSK